MSTWEGGRMEGMGGDGRGLVECWEGLPGYSWEDPPTARGS